MKKISLITCILIASICYSQNEAANWYFGDNAGINFDINTDTVTPLTNGLLATDEGCTSISDGNGDLLFYTDGITVFNQNHTVMVNGTNLKGNPSSTQSAIIIPKPNDDDIYYIFTVDTEFQGTPDEGFNFSEVDMSLDGGLGAVTALKNQLLLGNTSEKLSAVLKDCQTEAIWVVTLADDTGGEVNDTFYAYEVTDTGVNTTPVVSTLNIFLNERRGYLKFSPDGTKLAAANIGQGLYLFDFDLATGIVSNPQQIQTVFDPQGKPQSPYGLEFSPNNQLLYVTTYFETPQEDFNNPSAQYGALLQYDITAPLIGVTEQVLDERIMYRSALQLGPNGKIYRTLSDTYFNGIPFLSVINSPNSVGQLAGYQHAAIDLNGRSARQGLPPFIASFFTEKIDIIQDNVNTLNLPLCTGDTYTLVAENIPGATYTWSKDLLPIATPATPYELFIDEGGNYEVVIDLNNGDCDTKEGQAIVTYSEIPTATQPQDMDICDDDNDGLWTFDLSTQNNTILNGQNPLEFEVSYHISLMDAETRNNPLPLNYQNTLPQETIYVRVENIINTNCSDTTVSFNIQVFTTPEVVNVSTFEVCDDTTDGDATNGQTNIILSNFDADILGAQNASIYTITYHANQNDADMGISQLPDPYYNVTPVNDTIIVRIENNGNSDCFDTESISITINPIPEAVDFNLFQCDEDGISDGFTLFNLTEADDTINGNSTNTTVSYYLTENDALNENGAVNASSYANATNPQILYALVKDNTTACYSIAELTLEVSATQITDYIAQPVCDELDSEDGINTFNLDNFSTDILANLPTGLMISYYETYDDALLEVSPLSSTYTNTTPYSQTIYVRVENDNACYGINEVLLTINPLPQLEDDETLLYCLNNFPEVITLEGGVINDLPNNYLYNWSSGQNTINIDVNEIGTYTVTVTNVLGCSKSRTITVEPSNIATIDSVEVVDGSLNNNQVTILASGEGIYQYDLINSNGISLGIQDSNVFTNVPAGIYTALVSDIKNNCGTVEELVSVIGFPQFFTPNADGVNDYWQVYGVSDQFQPNSIIYIFDRYGKLLSQISARSNGWDGTFNGELLPTNDYWFSVRLDDGRIYKNHFTLKRE